MTEQTRPAALTGPVAIVGTGLLGTSVALACRRAGLEVLLSDVSDDHVRTASGLGAGRPWEPDDRPQLVVVAVPPAELGTVIARMLDKTAAWGAAVTDVGSVKVAPLAEIASHEGAARYVGSHPMAGSERSGPLAASESLFEGRPWAVTSRPDASAEADALVTALADLCGAVIVRMTPEEHDSAVARTSHVPHLMSALVAGRLAEAPSGQLALSGQGVRDVTRVAAGDPSLYSQIVTGNAGAVVALLGEVRAELDRLIGALQGNDRDAVRNLLWHGVEGTRAIPGKHGGPVAPTTSVYVAVPDQPGGLARLFADAGEIGVNIEDVRIDHDPGRRVGMVELVVAEGTEDHLSAALEARSWAVHR